METVAVILDYSMKTVSYSLIKTKPLMTCICRGIFRSGTKKCQLICDTQAWSTIRSVNTKQMRTLHTLVMQCHKIPTDWLPDRFLEQAQVVLICPRGPLKICLKNLKTNSRTKSEIFFLKNGYISHKQVKNS